MNKIIDTILSITNFKQLKENFPNYVIVYKNSNRYTGELLVKLNKNIYVYTNKELESVFDFDFDCAETHLFQIYHISHELKNYKLLANYEYHESWNYIGNYVSDNYGSYTYNEDYPYYKIYNIKCIFDYFELIV